jgi:hypothetical protein
MIAILPTKTDTYRRDYGGHALAAKVSSVFNTKSDVEIVGGIEMESAAAASG